MSGIKKINPNVLFSKFIGNDAMFAAFGFSGDAAPGVYLKLLGENLFIVSVIILYFQLSCRLSWLQCLKYLALE